MKSSVDHIDGELASNPSDVNYLTEKKFVDEICEKHSPKTEESGEEEDDDDLELTGDQLTHYLEDLAQPCDEMLINCRFRGVDRKCSDIFRPIVTDEGMCCTFNTLPESVMYNNDVVDKNQTEWEMWSHWDLELGYFKGDPKLSTVLIEIANIKLRPKVIFISKIMKIKAILLNLRSFLEELWLRD